jgi:hypothetical protein
VLVAAPFYIVWKLTILRLIGRSTGTGCRLGADGSRTDRAEKIHD